MKKLIGITVVALAVMVLVRDAIERLAEADMPDWMMEQINRKN